MRAVLRVKEPNIDRVHCGEQDPRSRAPVTASFKPGLAGRLSGCRTNSAVVQRFQFSVLTSARNRDKPVHVLPASRLDCRRDDSGFFGLATSEVNEATCVVGLLSEIFVHSSAGMSRSFAHRWSGGAIAYTIRDSRPGIGQ